MLKKIAYIVITAILLTGFMITLAGCPDNPNNDVNNPVVETEHFRVQLRKSDGYAVAFELTEEGEKQEILVVPDYVQGLPVKHIGWHKGYVVLRFRSTNAKKIYLPHTVTNVTKTALGGLGQLEETIFISIMPNQSKEDDFLGGGIGKLFVTKDYYLYIYGNLAFESNFLLIPNLTYYYNYSDALNSGYYWIDNITGTNLYMKPTPPIREGFVFAGWFLEPECLFEWDGTMPASKDEKLELYASWTTSN